MSKEIDEKVVEMRFDNRDFEANVKDTMRTLDAFKKELRFDGATEGFESIEKAANKVDMSGMITAVETASHKFSTLEIVAMSALNNITNRVVDMGINLAKSISIDQITQGWNKYGEKISSVQTLLNSTGLEIEEINEYLDQLMWFSDETSYSFTDMTSALATMTSAGGDIKKLIPMITGIANATAYAGKGAAEFSRVMYNLNQSYSAGALTLMDWKSVQNANVNSKQLIETLIQVGEELGRIKKGEVTVGNFTDSLKKKWADTSVMEKAFGKFSALSQEAYKQVKEEKYETASEAIEALSKDFDELAVKAFRSAQEAKTFKEAIDATKDAVSSGWMRIWEAIFGDYKESKQLWTNLANSLYDILVEPMNTFYEKILSSSMAKSFTELTDRIKSFVKPIDNVTSDVKEIVKNVSDYSKIVDEIISGKWGTQQSRWDKLTEAGYDWAYAQNLVNEKLGSSVRHTTDFSDKQVELINVEKENVKTLSEYIEALTELSDEELKTKNYNDDEIQSFRELQSVADSLGLSVGELIDKSDDLNGRYMFLESFANIGRSIIGIFSSIKKAFREAFFPMKDEDMYNNISNNLFNIITGFYRLSNVLVKFVDKNSENLIRTFKGLFSILRVISTLINGVLKIGITLLNNAFSLFGKTTGGVLSVTAEFGDILVLINNILVNKIVWAFDKINTLINFVITSVKNLITSNKTLVNVYEFLKNKFNDVVNIIKDYLLDNNKLIEGLTLLKDNIKQIIINTKEWIQNNEKLKAMFENIKNGIDNAKQSLKEWFKSFSEKDGIGKNIIDGLANGLRYGFSKVINIIITLANKIKETFCKLLGINSPSVVFFEYGKNIIEGLINGIKNVFPNLLKIFENIYDKIKELNLGRITDFLLLITTLLPQLKALNLARQFLLLFKACGIESIKGLKEGLSGDNFRRLLDFIKSIANSIINTFKDIFKIKSPSKVFIAIGGFIISGLLIGLKDGADKIPETLKGIGNKIIDFFKNLNLNKIIGICFGIGSLVLFNNFIKMLSKFGDVAGTVTSPLKALSSAIKTFGNSLGTMLTDIGSAQKTKANAEMIKGISLLLLAIVGSIYIISKVNKDDLLRSSLIIIGMTAFITGIAILLTVMSSKFSAGGSLSLSNGKSIILDLVAIAGSILLLALAIKAIANIDLGDNAKEVIWRLVGIIGTISALMIMSNFVGKNALKAGVMILAITEAMRLFIKLLKEIDDLQINNTLKVLSILNFMILEIDGLMIVSNFVGKNALKAGIMILAITKAMEKMVTVIKLINVLSEDEINKATKVITGISAIFVGFMIASMFANNAAKAGLLFLGFTASMLLLVGAIKAINLLTEDEIKKASKVILGIGIIFTALIAISKLAGNAIGAASVILSFSASLYIIVGAIALINMFTDEEIKKAGKVIASMSVVFAALMAVSKLATGSIGTIITLSVAIGILVGAVSLLTLLDQTKLENSTKCLTILIGTMAALMAVTKLAGNIGTTIAVLGTITTVMYLLAGVLKLMEAMDLQNGLQNSEALSLLLMSMSSALLILSAVGKIGFDAALQGIGAFSILIVALGTLLGAIGGLTELFPDLEKFIEKGGEIFTKIGKIIGEFVGNIVKGFGSSVLDLLPIYGTKLSEFADKSSAFFKMVESIGPNSFNAVKNLAESLLVLTENEMLQGISRFLHLGGKNTLDDFGKQLIPFAVHFIGFAQALQNLPKDSESKVKTVCEAIKYLSEANATVENSGGLLAAIVGDNKLDDFGKQLIPFAVHLVGFTQALQNLPKDSESKVKAACEAIKYLSEANATVKNSGGLLAAIVGDNKLDDFGSQLEGLGKGLGVFIASISGYSDSEIILASKSVSVLIHLLSNIPNTNVISEMSNFGSYLMIFGYNIEEFINTITNIGEETITICIEKINELITMTKDISLLDLSSLESFSQKLILVAYDGVNGFCSAFSGLEPIKKVKIAISTMLNECLKEAESKKDKFKMVFIKLMESSINGLESKKDDAVKVIKDTCQLIIEHINSKYFDIYNAGANFANGFVQGINDNTYKILDAGANFVNGFVQGINNNAYKALDAARNMAIQALIATQQALDSHSPSKETEALGIFFSQGFINGIKNYFGKVYNTAFDSGELAKSGLKDAIDRINTIIDDDINLQPRITPILDLSNVRSGFNDLNSIFNLDRVNSNLNAISNVNLGNQNGSHNDVVSAINKLSDSLNSHNGNIINIYPQELDKDSLNEIVNEVNRQFGKVYK